MTTANTTPDAEMPPDDELKACPFCGGHHATVLKHFEDGDCIIHLGAYKDDVRKKCKLHGFGMARYATEEEAIRDWNTRPSPSVERFPMRSVPIDDLPSIHELQETINGLSSWLNMNDFVWGDHAVNAGKYLERVLAALKRIGGAG